MYHSRFKGSHFDGGFHYGNLLYKKGIKIEEDHQLGINEEKREFAKQCIIECEKVYPELLEEIKGIAQGQHMDYLDLAAFLFGMYCFELNNHCTCLAFADEKHIIFGRNSDFLVSLEKYYDSCYYCLDNAYAFIGNTTAMVQIEDGINEYGLAIGLTFIVCKQIKPGLNAGLLVRYLLEKCKTVKEALCRLQKLPISSSQTITMLDTKGNMVVVECNCEHIEIIQQAQDENFVVSTNHFNSSRMQKYQIKDIDDWRSKERYQVARNTLKKQQSNDSHALIKDILSGKYGFMCQYNRHKNADTVWSIIYDLKNNKIYRCEGNPSRKKFKEDHRLSFIDQES